MKIKLVLPLIVGSVAFLSACGSSPPDAQEIASEAVNAQESLSDSAKDCMNDVVANFELTDAEIAAGAGENLDDAAAKAADGNEESQKVIDRFEAELATCN